MQQRVAMAWAVLRALPPETVVDVANTVLPERTCQPIPPLFSYMDEAAFWADMAEPEALDAYCLASFNAMTGPRQAAFLEFVQTLPDWIASHVRAFDFFGGVPGMIVSDNLKAGVINAFIVTASKVWHMQAAQSAIGSNSTITGVRIRLLPCARQTRHSN